MPGPAFEAQRGNSLLYQRVAEELSKDIRQGVYSAGQKIPSVRKLALKRQVSISTVTQAYSLLEDRGIIHAKPQSGYFVRFGFDSNAAAPPVSAGDKPSEITKGTLIKQMLQNSQRPGTVGLGAAIPESSLLPQRAIQTHMQKAARFHNPQNMAYQFSPGYEPLRRLIAQRMRHIAVRCHQEEVIITNGCTEALSLCLRAATVSGDTIAVESPCYYGFLQMAEMLNLKVIEIPTDPNKGMSIEALQLALEQWSIRLVILGTRFSNPTGCTIPKQRQQALMRLLERHDISAIEDDIYGEFGNGADNHSTLKSLDSAGRVMYCSSFSKTVAPGLRVGWCLPGRKMERVKSLQTFSTLAPASLPQLGLASYLETGHYEKHLRAFRRTVSENLDRYSTAIRKHFPAETLFSKPAGGFVLWLCLPKAVDGIKLQQQALEQGISIVPGDVFSNTSHFSNYIRLSCALPWGSEVRDAIKLLGDLVYEACP